jgi:hypothetical protein
MQVILKPHKSVLCVCALNVFIALLAPSGGCSRKPSAQSVCVQNMQQLWEAARAQFRVRRGADDLLINPSELTNYLRGGVAPICPLGTNPYAPFSYREGPKCPNSDAHTQALRSGRS